MDNEDEGVWVAGSAAVNCKDRVVALANSIDGTDRADEGRIRLLLLAPTNCPKCRRRAQLPSRPSDSERERTSCRDESRAVVAKCVVTKSPAKDLMHRPCLDASAGLAVVPETVPGE
jgi:hypothetical protein